MTRAKTNYFGTFRGVAFQALEVAVGPLRARDRQLRGPIDEGQVAHYEAICAMAVCLKSSINSRLWVSLNR